jgi:lipoate-protein ligase A
MQLLYYSYPTPVENIAIDEFLLDEVNKNKYTDGICRIWESEQTFVVLGLSKNISDDVLLSACMNDNISILKRCSGGGTVLQGPGCFNYSYILPITAHPMLESVSGTTRHILLKVLRAIGPIVPNAAPQGISDLGVGNLKFSGNAQRRLKHAVLFHGTLLYNFNLDNITRYLAEPRIQPKYRNQRPHQLFVQNITTSHAELVNEFSKTTTSPMPPTAIPKEYINKVNERSRKAQQRTLI